RQQTRQQDGAHAGTRHELRRVFREDAGVLAAVVADDDRGLLACGLLQQIGGEPCRGLRHQHAVHAVGAGFDAPAEAGGAELQALVKAVMERDQCGRVAVGGALDQALKFGAGLGIRVLREPGLRLLDDRGSSRALSARIETSAGHSSPTIRARSALMTGSAALPASMTSAWLSGVFWMPAARFVMSESPRISMPA